MYNTTHQSLPSCSLFQLNPFLIFLLSLFLTIPLFDISRPIPILISLTNVDTAISSLILVLISQTNTDTDVSKPMLMWLLIHSWSPTNCTLLQIVCWFSLFTLLGSFSLNVQYSWNQSPPLNMNTCACLCDSLIDLKDKAKITLLISWGYCCLICFLLKRIPSWRLQEPQTVQFQILPKLDLLKLLNHLGLCRYCQQL